MRAVAYSTFTHDEAHEQPGCIFVNERAGSTEVKQNILKDKTWAPKVDQLLPYLHLVFLYSGSGICTRRSGNSALIT